MLVYIEIFSYVVPSYGLMISLGLVVSNVVALAIIKRKRFCFDDFLLIEAWTLLLGGLGAKLLYLITSSSVIDWNRIIDLEYLAGIMNGGFVFYGGLIGGLIGLLIAKYLHKIDVKKYLYSLISIVPLGHCFGRIGCFMAGCCYGIPYSGLGSIVFTNTPYAPNNVSLFPVQIVEALLLLILSCIIFAREIKKSDIYNLIIYGIGYSCIRFILEYFRADSVRGFLFGLSISQWISMGLLTAMLIAVYTYKKRNKENKK